MKRNIGMHTSAEDAQKNIILGLLGGRGTNKSGLGFMAFPGYNFKAPQGAAFAVAKIARQMEVRGLIVHLDTYHGGEYTGYRIILTSKGEAEAEKLKGGAA